MDEKKWQYEVLTRLNTQTLLLEEIAKQNGVSKNRIDNIYMDNTDPREMIILI